MKKSESKKSKVEKVDPRVAACHSQECWNAFVIYCETNGIDVHGHVDDWMPSWDIFFSGVCWGKWRYDPLMGP